MAQDYAASVMGSFIRVTRLGLDGEPLYGADTTYQTSGFISMSFTPEYEEGDEFTQKDANGKVCVTYRGPDTLKRVNLSIALCAPDPEFTSTIAGGVILGAGPDESIGWAAPKVGEDATPNGVAIEVWSNAITDGKPNGTNPYFHWIFPYARMRESGERVIQNDILASEYEGWAVGNVGFGAGPIAPLWAFPEYSDRAYAFARSATLPTGTSGFVETIAPV